MVGLNCHRNALDNIATMSNSSNSMFIMSQSLSHKPPFFMAEILKFCYLNIQWFPGWWCNNQWEEWHPMYEMENKIHVWNHQPV